MDSKLNYKENFKNFRKHFQGNPMLKFLGTLFYNICHKNENYEVLMSYVYNHFNYLSKNIQKFKEILVLEKTLFDFSPQNLKKQFLSLDLIVSPVYNIKFNSLLLNIERNFKISYVALSILFFCKKKKIFIPKRLLNKILNLSKLN
jgi:hypothetical protein